VVSEAFIVVPVYQTNVALFCMYISRLHDVTHPCMHASHWHNILKIVLEISTFCECKTLP
jgi:hypothetical protein